MMGNVIMRNIVQEIAAHPAEQWAIDGTRRTTKEVPCRFAVMWEGGIRMLQLIHSKGGSESTDYQQYSK